MLLSNVITNETLPIVLDRGLGGGWPAVVSSTVLIVIFGEIIPQSVSVRFGLGIGALFAPFVLCLMYIMFPVAYPTAILLDYVLGEDHGTVYRKAQLKTLVTLHSSMGVERLNRDEVTIISAVLDLNEKPVKNIMTLIDDVYTMSADRILDQDAVDEILKAGYSRIPIHTPSEPTNFIGMLLVRILISYDPEDAQPVSTFPLATLPETRPDTTCLNVLNYFQEGKSHMMLVSEYPGEAYGALGVLTLEDVIEELIGEEIVDESDVFVDISQGIRRKYLSPMTRRMLPAEFVAQRVNPPRVSEGNATALSSRQPSMIDISSPTDSHPLLVSASNQTPAHSFSPAAFNSLKVNPLNMAMHPNETTNSKVTIKRGAMEDYVRRASLDKGYAQGNIRYGPPHAGINFGTIHESEQDAIKDATGNLNATGNLGASTNLRLSMSNTGKEAAKDSRKGSAYELESINSKNEFRNFLADSELLNQMDDRNVNGTSEYDGAENFHASGIIESVREVHGFRKTIIESTAISDDDSSSISSSMSDTSNTSGKSGDSNISGKGDSNTGYRKKKPRIKQRSSRRDSNNSASKVQSGERRKSSFFSDHGMMQGIIDTVTGHHHHHHHHHNKADAASSSKTSGIVTAEIASVDEESASRSANTSKPSRPERSDSSNGGYSIENRPLLRG